MSISQRNDGRFIVKFKDGTKWKQKSFRAREDAEAFERSLEYDESENNRLTVSESILLFLSRTKHVRQTEQYYRMRRKTPPFRAGDIRRVRRICVSN